MKEILLAIHVGEEELGDTPCDSLVLVTIMEVILG